MLCPHLEAKWSLTVFIYLLANSVKKSVKDLLYLGKRMEIRKRVNMSFPASHSQLFPTEAAVDAEFRLS